MKRIFLLLIFILLSQTSCSLLTKYDTDIDFDYALLLKKKEEWKNKNIQNYSYRYGPECFRCSSVYYIKVLKNKIVYENDQKDRKFKKIDDFFDRILSWYKKKEMKYCKAYKITVKYHKEFSFPIEAKIHLKMKKKFCPYADGCCYGAYFSLRGFKTINPEKDKVHFKSYVSGGLSRKIWIKTDPGFSKINGIPSFTFYNEAEHKFKDKAKEMTQRNLEKRLKLEIIKKLKEIFKKQNFTRFINYDNINFFLDINQLMKIGIFWNQIVKTKVKNGKVVGWSHPVFVYKVRYALNYKDFLNIFKGIIKNLLKNNKITKEMYSTLKDYNFL